MPTEMKIIEDDKNKKPPQKTKLLKLSASSMKTFEQCPRKYFYNYIARKPRKKWDDSHLGNLCHKVLEIFHKIYIHEGVKGGSLNKLMGHSFSEGRKSFPKIKSELLAEAKQLIQDYLKFVSHKGMPYVKGVETSFKINITKDILIRGFIDRVDILPKNGIFHIVDYKTSKNKKYLEPFQLLIYGLWLQSEYPDIEEYKASYVLLRHGSSSKSYDFNKEDLNKVEKKIITFAEGIRGCEQKNSWAPIPSPLCNYCDFREFCETQKQGW